jgi:hypothetical protein
MSNEDESQTATPVATAPSLPEVDLHVDFGVPAPGSSNPMPPDRRDRYESRIRNAVDAQAAGAEKASQLFIR